MSVTDPTCQEIVELMTEYLDEAMTPERRDLFERHPAYCVPCVEFLEQMRAAVRLTGTLREEELPGDVVDRLVVAFRNWRE